MPLPLQEPSGSDQQSQQQQQQQQQQRHLLLQAAKAFCTSFAQKSKTPAEIVEAHFSSSPHDHEITAYEHGLPELGLPFVGRAFRGRDGVRAYFETVGTCLSYADMRFPAAAAAAAATASHSTIAASASKQDDRDDGDAGAGADEFDDDDDDDDETKGWVVDAAARKVSVKGSAEFTWVATGESWREVFAYVLTFDDEGQEAPKLRAYEVWADTGAAWLASRGELDRVRKEEGGHRAGRDRMNTFGSVS